MSSKPQIIGLQDDNDARKLLSPCIIGEQDDSYHAVEDLCYVLKEESTKNIAVTGNYGSGKSSVVNTCFKKMDIEDKVLRISLSTFDLGDNNTQDDIEYKIVQHMLYKSDRSKTPFSWFHTIKHKDDGDIVKNTLAIIAAVLCYIIAFEPENLQIDSFYDTYHNLFGNDIGDIINAITDVLSVGYLLVFSFWILLRLLRRFYRLRNVKLEIKGFKMETSDNLSVFNKYLDEIVYTIKQNEYSYILFEDLDRLKDSQQLFLKIRELNMLINESESFRKAGKVVKFIYAIKDDLFTRELRTKCFDYIVAVMPVVDHYNVLDYLMTEYRGKKLFMHISDRELEQISNRITGLRELKNIVNEYQLFERSLKKHLDDDTNSYEKKLLAMVVYKNLFPQDFAKIYEKKGLLYTVINKRVSFEIALTGEKRDQLKELEAKLNEEKGEIIKVRRKFIEVLVNHHVKTVSVNKEEHTLEELAENDRLWHCFVNDGFDSYYYANEAEEDAGDEEYNFDFKEIEKEVAPGDTYDNMVKNYRNSHFNHYMTKGRLEKEIKVVEHSKLSDLIHRIGFEESKKIIRLKYNELYRDDKRLVVPEVETLHSFIYNGFIEDDYYLYITKFYPGTLSEEDFQNANAFIQGIERPYDTRLGNVEGIVKKLRLDDFEKKSILNYDLLKFLMQKDSGTYLMPFINTARNHPDFVVGYYQAAAESDDSFFDEVFKEWNGCVSVIVKSDSDEQRELLLLLFFMVSPMFVKIEEDEHAYLENQYEFICDHISALHVKELKDFIKHYGFTFEKLVRANNQTKELYDYCLTKKFFAINLHNLEVILGEGFKTKTITELLAMENKAAKAYIQEHLSAVVKMIPETSNLESREALEYLMSSNAASKDWIIEYITRQNNTFDTVDNLDGENVDIVLQADKLECAWHNVLDAFKTIGSLSNALRIYIIRHAKELSKEKCYGDDSKTALHKAIFTEESLPIQEFKYLLRSFDLNFSLEEIQVISDDKIEEVIRHKKIGVDTEIFAYLQTERVDQLANYYFIRFFDRIMDLEGIELSQYVNNNMCIAILDSHLTLEQKKRFLDGYVVINKGGEGTTHLAKLICHYYLEIGVDGATQQVVIDALNWNFGDNSWETKIKLINRCNATWPYSKELENKLLFTLRGEYVKLTTPRGWANFDINPENSELLTYLNSHGHYISNIQERDNQLYVTFKHS